MELNIAPVFTFITRQLVRMEHLNSHGNLFGGQMFSWIDEAAAMYIMEQTEYGNLVTVSMDKMSFLAPGKLGSQISFYGRVLKIGRSSIEVEIRAEGFDFKTKEKTLLTHVRISFVLLGQDNHPYPYFEHHPDIKEKLCTDFQC